MKPEVLLMMRERADLTQGALAELLGVTQGTISNAERGHRGPSLELVEGWAEACGFDLVVLPKKPAAPSESDAASPERQEQTPLHDQLIALRQRLGLNQRELAERIGATSQTVSRIEAGTREPSVQVLMKWLEVCDVRLNLLAEREPQERTQPGSYPEYLAQRLVVLSDDLGRERLETLAAVLDVWEKQVKIK